MKITSIVIKAGKQIFKHIGRMFIFFSKHKELTLILFLSFIIRYFLLDWNSYWLDELYSVYRLNLLEAGDTIKFANVFEFMKFRLARPTTLPLYEFILFNWMSLFGRSEMATRALSTVYVTLSILFIYLFSIKVFTRRIAIAAALMFSLSYMAVFYSLEARYYGQMLFLSTLSSYLLYVYLENMANHNSWRDLFLNKYFILLTLANVALMLTHAFDFIFIAAQSFFMLLYLLYQNKFTKPLSGIAKVLALYLAQLAVLFALSGTFIFRGLLRSALNFSALPDQGIGNETGSALFVPYKNPLIIFMNYVVKPNLDLPAFAYLVLFILLTVAMIKYLAPLHRRSQSDPASPQSLYVLYMVVCAFLPCVLVYLIFSIGQFDKLTPRYLIYSTPPLMVLLVLALEQGLLFLNRMSRRILGISIWRHYLRHATIYLILAAIVLVLPGGLRAATYRKDDWRGIAKQIVQRIHEDPDHKYVVYETTFRRFPMLDFYFEQYSDHVRVHGVIQRSVEQRLAGGDNYIPHFFRARDLREIEKSDYMIIAFTHHKISDFPHTLDILSADYELLSTHLNAAGKGYLLFSAQYDDEYAQYKEEMIKGGLTFNGENSYVDLGFSPGFNAEDSFTFELWIKLLGDVNKSAVLFGPRESRSGAYGLHAYYQERLSFGVRTDEDMARVDFTNYRLNTWYHLAGVYNGYEKKVYFYVDGELIGTDHLEGKDLNLSGKNFGLNLPETIHGESTETGHVRCIKHEARLWNVARSQEEIKAHMFKQLEGRESGLIGYWPLNEASGPLAHDLSANHNHGFIHGGTWNE